MNISAQNTRTVKLSWKTDKKTGVKRDTVIFEMPQTDYDFSRFSPYLISYLNGVQDRMIREMIEAGKPIVQAMNQVSQDHMIEWLKEEQKSGRLTKEIVSAWFDAELSDLLAVALADALGVSDTPTPEQSHMIELTVAAHKEKISALAGGATSYAPKIAEKLLKTVELLDTSSDVIAARFAERLEGMIAATDDTLLGL